MGRAHTVRAGRAMAGAGGPLPRRRRRREDVERRVPSASVLHSNGDALDIAVRGGRIVGVRGHEGDPGQPRAAGPEGPVRMAGRRLARAAHPAAGAPRRRAGPGRLGRGDGGRRRALARAARLARRLGPDRLPHQRPALPRGVLSADDAEGLGVVEGDRVAVESRSGRVEARGRITAIRPGLVFIPFHYGYWDRGAAGPGDGPARAANELVATPGPRVQAAHASRSAPSASPVSARATARRPRPRRTARRPSPRASRP